MFRRWNKSSTAQQIGSLDEKLTSSTDSLIRFSKSDHSVSQSNSGVSGQVEIYLNKKLNCYYAVKRYNKRENHETKQEYIDRILHEYNILQQLSHFNIIKVYHYKVSLSGNVKLYLEAGSSNLYILLRNNKLIHQSEIFCIWRQILLGLNYLHSIDICHRDLKLQNIVLDLNFGIVKIIDFVTSFKSINHEFALGLVGSENYSSPEQFSQISYDGFKSDIWSLAVCLYQLATRKLPWKSARFNDPGYIKYCNHDFHPEDLLKILPQGKQLVTQMFDIDPENRISTISIINNPWIKTIKYCNGLDNCGYDHLKLINNQ